MQRYRIIFFGSTSDSVLVLERIFGLQVSAIVTQPPRPVGRSQEITPTPVALWANDHNVPVLTFPNRPDRPSFYRDEQTVIDTLQPFQADLIISASYGIKIPKEIITSALFGGLNIHPSLLPRWRGADPVPWAILSGDHQTGVTIATLTNAFDSGSIVAQKKIPITQADFAEPLRTKLFTLGANLLIQILPDYLQTYPSVSSQHTPGVNISTHLGKQPYARKLTREDGFEPWEILQKAIADGTDADRIERKFRALTPWPGVWTEVELRTQSLEFSKKRVKILSCHLNSKLKTLNPTLIIDSVQLEGKKPVSFAQFSSAYLPPVSS